MPVFLAVGLSRSYLQERDASDAYIYGPPPCINERYIIPGLMGSDVKRGLKMQGFY